MERKKARRLTLYEYTGQTYVRNKQHVVNRLLGRGIARKNILSVKYGKKGTRFRARVLGR